MESQEQIELLRQGSDVWNAWRSRHPEVKIDLSKADLFDANLSGTILSEAYLIDADLSRADLSKADLSKAILFRANLIAADLSETDLSDADLSKADLSDAILFGADLSDADLIDANLINADLGEAYLIDADLRRANLSGTNLSGTNLSGANLRRTTLVKTNLTGATLTQCSIYGISAWDVQLDGAKQEDLVITDYYEPTITVDNLEVAQFIYLLLNNTKIRDIINTSTKKVVLILGRFTPNRKAVLDALRKALRQQNYLPVLFDFEKPASRDLTETVSTLAHLARFIIVDLTDPSSAPHEAATIIPHCIVPVQPILLQDELKTRHEYAMFHDLRTRYHWVLPTYQYQDITNLLASLKERIIDPAEQKAQELAKR